jgi:LmbE family N-acetylglucosaminyl deacetylase
MRETRETKGGETDVNVLAIGAHPDDIEIGCAGTLIAHRVRGDRVAMLVMTVGERGPQDLESRVQEQENAAAIIGADLFWGGFDDGAVPEGRVAIDLVDSLVRELDVDVLYTHVPADTHQDHRATSTAALAAGRRVPRVLMYEAPTSQRFQPSLFVEVGDFVEGKLAAIGAHTSQVLKNRLVDLEAVEAQARVRGFEARIPHGYAEGFVVARFVWGGESAWSLGGTVDLTLEEEVKVHA